MNGATNGNKWQQLSVKQQNAIDILVTGKTDAEVAEAVGVNRVTVTKWRNYHPGFQAELNRRRRNMWGASAERLRGLLPKALDVIEAELRDGKNKLRAAVQVTKLAGLESVGAPGGFEDVAEIIDRLVGERVQVIQAERNRSLSLDSRVLLDLQAPDVEQEKADWAAAQEAVLVDIEARLDGARD